MKLTIFAALVAIAYSLTTESQTGTGDAMHKRETVQDYPKTNVELIYKLSHVRDALNEALENGVSPHRWYFAKQDVAGLVEAARTLNPVMTEIETKQFNDEISSIYNFTFPRGDAAVVQACSQDNADQVCALYTFKGYVDEVAYLSRHAESIKTLSHQDKGYFSATKNSLQRGIARIDVRIERLKEAPVDMWKSEPGFDATQKLLRKAKKMIDEESAFLKVKPHRASLVQGSG
ncbi:hypothetical protein OXX69_000366 [Metschnikowia pulcherrima]